jgi:hypothetical protein
MGNEFKTLYKSIYPADFQYWTEKGWMDRSKYYYTSAKIGAGTKLLARIAVALVMVYLRRTLFSEAGKVKPARQEEQAKNTAR